MLTKVYRRLLIPTFESLAKHRLTFRYMDCLEQTQWLGEDELLRMQVGALRELLAHCEKNCPYYREAWQAAGLCAASLGSLADFHAWPIVERDTIRQHRLQMRSQLPGRLISKATGGSSGVPLQFDLNPDSNDRRMAAWHRGYAWAGAGLGTRQLYFWGVPLTKQAVWRHWKDAAYNRLYRRKVVSCFGFQDSDVVALHRLMQRYRPEAIVAYTNPLYALARALRERGLKPYSPRCLVVGAEKLHDFQRELIEDVFAAPVFETYGSREFMLIGAQCEQRRGLHMTMEHLLVEVLDDAGNPAAPGEEGNVVITDLFNYGMPFVRYANGDRAIAGDGACPCGRGLRTLTKIVGRRLDVLMTPDGRSVPGEVFPHLLKDFNAVRRFQVVQESLDRIELRVVVDSRWNAADEAAIQRALRDILGPATKCEIAVVADIPLTAAGKLQVVVNHALDANTSVLDFSS